MDRVPLPSVPGQTPAVQATGKSFYQRWAERGDEVSSRWDQPPPAELEQVRWLVGTWSTGGTAFATPTTPERRVEHPDARLPCRFVLGDRWLLFEGEWGRPRRFHLVQYLTFDPRPGHWVLVFIEHPTGCSIRTAPGWTDNQLVFEGVWDIVGETVEMRHRLVKQSDDAWKWENDEMQADGKWLPIDEHRYTRVTDEGAVPGA
jgi:hypothetical protein